MGRRASILAFVAHVHQIGASIPQMGASIPRASREFPEYLKQWRGSSLSPSLDQIHFVLSIVTCLSKGLLNRLDRGGEAAPAGLPGDL